MKEPTKPEPFKGKLNNAPTKELAKLKEHLEGQGQEQSVRYRQVVELLYGRLVE